MNKETSSNKIIFTRNIVGIVKAKIEAVIYAADEPVTLAQLVAVFAPEVREIWQAEQQEAAAVAAEDAAASRCGSEGSVAGASVVT